MTPNSKIIISCEKFTRTDFKISPFSSALPQHSPTSSHSTANEGSPTGYSAAFLSAKTEPSSSALPQTSSLSSLYPQVPVSSLSHSGLGLDPSMKAAAASAGVSLGNSNPSGAWPSSASPWPAAAASASGLGGDSWYASQMSAAAAHPYSHYANPYTGSGLGAGLHDSFAAQVLDNT